MEFLMNKLPINHQHVILSVVIPCFARLNQQTQTRILNCKDKIRLDITSHNNRHRLHYTQRTSMIPIGSRRSQRPKDFSNFICFQVCNIV